MRIKTTSNAFLCEIFYTLLGTFDDNLLRLILLYSLHSSPKYTGIFLYKIRMKKISRLSFLCSRVNDLLTRKYFLFLGFLEFASNVQVQPKLLFELRCVRYKKM